MSLPELNVSLLNDGSTVVLFLSGHLNALTVGGLESSLDKVLSGDVQRIVFDCEMLTFTSSAGLRVFLSTAKRMKSRSGTCAFASLSPTVHEVFEMAGFLDAMEIHPTRDAALSGKC